MKKTHGNAICSCVCVLTPASLIPRSAGEFCVWMAAMQGHGLHGPSLQEDFVGYNDQTVIISESTSRFLSST